MAPISVAKTDAEIQRCFPVMLQLRPHLVEAKFLDRIRQQEAEFGYRLAYLEERGVVKAVAGFRVSRSLAWGKFLYVDDLVTLADDRGTGLGQQLMEWLLEQARASACDEFHLDSGVQRFQAHGFYLKNRLHITSHHFSRVFS
jgi:GNAT superfamily N-acetyltransferase